MPRKKAVNSGRTAAKKGGGEGKRKGGLKRVSMSLKSDSYLISPPGGTNQALVPIARGMDTCGTRWAYAKKGRGKRWANVAWGVGNRVSHQALNDKTRKAGNEKNPTYAKKNLLLCGNFAPI